MRNLILSIVLSGLVSAQEASKPTCVPNTLHISNKVTHRPNKLVIGHRGASYHLPEHTAGGYRLALELGADYIEPDLVATKDGRLIALHTVDLNVTTNVAEVFGDRETWYSPTVNRSGYWTFNFTYQDIQTLTVKQRLPKARSGLYDNLWTIPSLDDILDVLYHWNIVDLPQTLPQDSNEDSEIAAGKPTQLQLAQSGLYIEFKDAEWLQKEAGLNLVDLLYQHLTDHADQWNHLLTCFQEIRFDQYKLPGLVIQSFEADALKAFHTRWKDFSNDQIPEPPYILLVDNRECHDVDFWYRVGDEYREFVKGIGCEKSCLTDPEDLPVVRTKEFGMVLHPWTERPEQEYMMETFKDVMEELMYLFCKVGAQGVFSESVHHAVMAATIGCDEMPTEAPQSVPTKAPVASPTEGGNTNNEDASTDLCYLSDAEANLYIGLASFVMGIFVSALVAFAVGRRRRRRYGGGRVIPTEQFESDLELT